MPSSPKKTGTRTVSATAKKTATNNEIRKKAAAKRAGKTYSSPVRPSYTETMNRPKRPSSAPRSSWTPARAARTSPTASRSRKPGRAS